MKAFMFMALLRQLKLDKAITSKTRIIYSVDDNKFEHSYIWPEVGYYNQATGEFFWLLDKWLPDNADLVLEKVLCIN